MPNSVKGFRLDNDIISDLRKESREKGITLNNHVSNILKKYNDSYRHYEKMRYVCVSPELLSNLAKNSDQNMKKIVKAYQKDLKMQIMCSMGNLTSQNIMRVIEKRSTIQGVSFNEEDNEDGSIRYHIIHSLGINWSIMQKTVLESLMNVAKTEITDFDYDDLCISFTVKHKS